MEPAIVCHRRVPEAESVVCFSVERVINPAVPVTCNRTSYERDFVCTAQLVNQWCPVDFVPNSGRFTEKVVCDSRAIARAVFLISTRWN